MRNVTHDYNEQLKLGDKSIKTFLTSDEFKYLLLTILYITAIISAFRIGKHIAIHWHTVVPARIGTIPDTGDYISAMFCQVVLLYGGIFKLIPMLFGGMWEVIRETTGESRSLSSVIWYTPYISVFIVFNNLLHYFTGTFFGTHLYIFIEELFSQL